jgi:hypothetical protein
MAKFHPTSSWKQIPPVTRGDIEGRQSMSISASIWVSGDRKKIFRPDQSHMSRPLYSPNDTQPNPAMRIRLVLLHLSWTVKAIDKESLVYYFYQEAANPTPLLFAAIRQRPT